MMKKTYLFLILSCFSLTLFAQEEPQKYVAETDSLVTEKLEKWQDLKFGLLMHWGTYSQWGIVESWSICPEDYGWCQRHKEGTPTTYNAYVEAYENLQLTFNPTQFNPEKWAKSAKDAGMKYVVFTTKHHDGFCMFDSKYTDYKITDPKTPFSTNKKANITKEIFNAFREEGLWAGAYFSKPDWHSDDYWWSYFPPKGRNVNYNPDVYPDKWQSFTDFTHNQIMELVSDYGKIDILWLDGGWIAKTSKAEVLEFYNKQIAKMNSGFVQQSCINQDIKMDELVEKVRKKQAGIIIVDRAVAGKNQNYLTPENKIPEKALPYPWESCIIAGGGWSYTPNASYMSPYKTIHTLVDVVCKGGNLLLNIAPGPDGTWDEDAYLLLKEVGAWLKINGEAIYGTRSIAPYKDSMISYTQKKSDNTIYAIYVSDESEKTLPAYIQINHFKPSADGVISILGYNNELKWKTKDNGILVEIPEEIRKKTPCKYAWSFKITHAINK